MCTPQNNGDTLRISLVKPDSMRVLIAARLLHAVLIATLQISLVQLPFTVAPLQTELAFTLDNRGKDDATIGSFVNTRIQAGLDRKSIYKNKLNIPELLWPNTRTPMQVLQKCG
jgi:hypothetical protein